MSAAFLLIMGALFVFLAASGKWAAMLAAIKNSPTSQGPKSP